MLALLSALVGLFLTICASAVAVVHRRHQGKAMGEPVFVLVLSVVALVLVLIVVSQAVSELNASR